MSLKSVRPPVKTSEELHFDAVVGDRPSTQKHDAALERGRKVMGKKDFDAAISAYEEALSYDGESAVARGELGYAISLTTTFGPGTDIMRSAEAIATEPAVRAAIAHNLAKSYLDANDIVLSGRAKRRSALLRKGASSGTNDADESSCPARVVPSHAIERTDWLGAYAKIAGDQAQAWGIVTPPLTQAAARAASCWRTSGSVEDPPTRSSECEGQMPWQVTTEHITAYQDVTHFVWPLEQNQVALYTNTLGGSMCSGEMSSSNSVGEGKRVGDFLIVALVEDNFSWVPSTSQCVMLARSHSVELYDIALGRGFRIDGLNADVTLGLAPKQHALTFTGATCDDYVDLNDIDDR